MPGRAYLGVGSEQNFTYIAATRPALAVIVDIRRGNFDLQLAYKALFELSTDRADFVSRLFSTAAPSRVGPPVHGVRDLRRLREGPAEPGAVCQEPRRPIETQLATKHGFALSSGDRDGLSFVYHAWFQAARTFTTS